MALHPAIGLWPGIMALDSTLLASAARSIRRPLWASSRSEVQLGEAFGLESLTEYIIRFSWPFRYSISAPPCHSKPLWSCYTIGFSELFVGIATYWQRQKASWHATSSYACSSLFLNAIRCPFTGTRRFLTVPVSIRRSSIDGTEWRICSLT